MTAPDPAGRGALLTGVQGLALRTRKTAEEAERQEIADELRNSMEAILRREMMVVVAGETNRGKSSLINALLDRPGLLPVSDDVSTSVHTVVRGAEGPDRARVSFLGGNTLDVAAADLGQWVLGEHDGEDVARVDVWVDHALLDGLALVDTPGVGGLSLAHGRAALSALELASAVVFVGDSGSPLSAVELDFLSQASERVGAVIVSLNRSDTHPGSEEIMHEDRELLSRRFERTAGIEFMLVSAQMKARGDRRAASQASADSLAEDLRRDSGVLSLRDALEGWKQDQASTLRAAMGCEATVRSLSRLAASAEEVISGVAEGSARRRERLAEAQRIMQGLERSIPKARQGLNHAVSGLPREMELRTSGAIADIRRNFEAKTKEKRGDDLGGDLVAELHRVTEEMMEEIAERSSAALGSALDQLAEYGVEVGIDHARVPREQIGLGTRPGSRREFDAKELLFGAPLIVVGVATGALPLAIAGASGVLVRAVHLLDRSQKMRARAEIAEVASEYQRKLSLLLHQVLSEGRSGLLAGFDEAVARRQTDLAETLAALTALEKQGSSEQGANRARAEAHLAAVSDLRRQADDLAVAIAGAMRPQSPLPQGAPT